MQNEEWNTGKQARAETLRLRLWLEKIAEENSDPYAVAALNGWAVEDMLEQRIPWRGAKGPPVKV